MKNVGRNNGAEDRISPLPDELIHCILSCRVNLNEVVKTCILSKRWLNLWRTFPDLNLADLRLVLHNDKKYIKFITKFLLGRAQQVEACSVYIHLTHGFDDSVRTQVLLTLNQAVSHCIRDLQIFKPKLSSYNLSFPVLTKLTLYKCNSSFMKWSLPCLTTLDISSVSLDADETVLNFKEFHCLKDLSLGGVFYSLDPPEFFRIDPPNLEILDIFQARATQIPGKFIISAPKLKCFTFFGRYVPRVSVEGGFLCLEQVCFSIDLGTGERVSLRRYLYEDYSWELDENQVNEIMLKISSLFRTFGQTKVLTLLPDTFEVLSRIPNFFKCQPSSFVNLNSLHLRGYKPKLPGHEYPSRSNNPVIKYLLSNSPGAEFIIQPFGGKRIVPQMSKADDNTGDADSDTLLDKDQTRS